MRPPVRRWIASGVLAFAMVALLAALLARWTITDDRLRDAALADIRRTSGVTITSTGRVTLRILPYPALQLGAVTMRALDGAVTLDADDITGRLHVLDLLRGKVTVGSVTLRSPTVVLDADRLQPWLSGLSDPSSLAVLARLHTPGVILRGGVIRIVSADNRRDTVLTDVSGSFEWPAGNAGASLAAVATWRGIAGDIQVDIDAPDRLIGGGQALASARLKSSTLELDADGTLSGSGETRVAGRLASSTPDLPALLRTIGAPTPQLAGLHQARLSGTAAITNDTLSLDGVTLTLDEMAFEGALAMHRREGRLGLAGTLATDSMVLDPFLHAFPPLLSRGGHWSTAPLETVAIANDDIDLRISATSARWGRLLLEDSSLSLQSGKGRLELSLGEARAYDGLLKGRVVATLDGEVTDVRAEATVSRLDVKELFRDLPGAYKATGTLTSHASVEGRGTTPADLMAALAGQAQVTIHEGEVGSRLLAAMFRPAPAAPRLPVALVIGGRTPFDAASLNATIAGGSLVVADSWIAWPSQRADIEGTASLAEQRLDLKARISDTSATPDVVYDFSGPWRDLTLRAVKPRP